MLRVFWRAIRLAALCRLSTCIIFFMLGMTAVIVNNVLSEWAHVKSMAQLQDVEHCVTRHGGVYVSEKSLGVRSFIFVGQYTDIVKLMPHHPFKPISFNAAMSDPEWVRQVGFPFLCTYAYGFSKPSASGRGQYIVNTGALLIGNNKRMSMDDVIVPIIPLWVGMALNILIASAVVYLVRTLVIACRIMLNAITKPHNR